MPRGRHRHSQPLHRLLPPAAVVGASVTCAAGAWLAGDTVMLRALVAAAAAAAVTGAVLMRAWDRKAGRRVAELERARVRDEWRTDERIAELEIDVEESRELRAALEGKLRSKRAELARLRNEHAELLRRYATAETERATALEGRRLLAIEAADPARQLLAGEDDRAANGAPTAATYLRASEALRKLTRNGARQQALRTVEEARRRDVEQREREGDEPRGKHAAAASGSGGPTRRAAASDPDPSPSSGTAGDASGKSVGTNDRTNDRKNDRENDRKDDRKSAGRTPGKRLPRRGEAVREHHTVPAAAAVVPYAPLRRPSSRQEGGFDFFGTAKAAKAVEAARKRPELTASAPEEDLADVVGAEALAEHEARQEEARQRQGGGDGVAEAEDSSAGQVIDLTEHDETEQLDLRGLRAKSS